MRNYPEIRPLKDSAELELLKAQAAEDGHRVIFPTHVFVRGSQVIGYASLMACVPLVPGAMPQAVQVNVWFSTREFHPRESFYVINALECIARCSCVARTLIVPCTKESPFFAHMAGMGYAPIMETTLWGKAI